MIVASGAYAVGQLFGVGILVAFAVGAAKTFLRKDLTLKEKVFGENEEPKSSSF